MTRIPLAALGLAIACSSDGTAASSSTDDTSAGTSIGATSMGADGSTGPGPATSGMPGSSSAAVDDSGGSTTDGGPSCVPPFEPPSFVASADDAIAFASLLEGSGNSAGAASDWVGIAAGRFCGNGESQIVALKNQHSFFAVLGGPTPVAVGAGDLSSSAAHPWRALAAGDLDGDGRDEVVAARHVTSSGVADLVLARGEDDCSMYEAASLTVGNPGNSSWVALAAGDFDGDGVDEAVAIKNESTQWVMLGLEGDALVLDDFGDLEGSAGAMPWRRAAAGDLDDDGDDELVLARSVDDSSHETVVVLDYDGGGFARIAGSTFGNNGNSTWLGLTVGDFSGDGHPAIVVAKESHSSFALLDLSPGSDELVTAGSSDLAAASGASWRGLAAVDWLGGDGGAAELVVARHTDERTNMLVYGDPQHRHSRTTALANTLAQYAGEPHPEEGGPADIDTLIEWLLTTHANAYSYLLWDITGQDYLDFVRFLDATRELCVDGRQMRVWVTLIPPTEHLSDKCSAPVDSPLTPYDDTSFFAAGAGEPSCEDYVGWSALLAQLGHDYPHFVGVNIDDATLNLDGALSPEVIGQMQRNLHGTPQLTLAPTFYYRASGTPTAAKYPDVGLSVDTLLFYFRNEKQGAGPCSGCDTPGPCNNACLAGTCAEATVANAPGEIADMATMLPGDRKLQLGAYFTGHSKCGEPSPAYDAGLVEAALADPHVDGVTVYVTHAPMIACDDQNWQTDKGCVVQHAFTP